MVNCEHKYAYAGQAARPSQRVCVKCGHAMTLEEFIQAAT